MKVNFITHSRISQINLTTIGDSEKRDDDTKIGTYSSGNAYATALLLRDGVDMGISVYGGEVDREVEEGSFRPEKFIEHYTYSTKVLQCDTTTKKKEIIVLNYEREYHGNLSYHNFSEPSESEQEIIETAFALQLGFNWEIFMSYRELMSNVLDEGGYVVEGNFFPDDAFIGTVITLEFDENNAFYEVWQNRHLYMNFNEPLHVISSSVEALENKENYLRIYKQNILVYEDRERPSRYAWNIKFGEIDERRLLRDVYNVEQSITSAILSTNNEEFLREIITTDFFLEDKEFLSNSSSYYSASDLSNKIASEVYEKFGEVHSYDFLISKIRSRKDCLIGGKKIKTIEDSIWSYSKEVTIESAPQIIQDEVEIIDDEVVSAIHPLQKEINKHYRFKLDVEVKTAKLRGSKCVADKYMKCIILNEDFNVETDFSSFLVEYLDLTMDGNVLENLSVFACNLLKNNAR